MSTITNLGGPGAPPKTDQAAPAFDLGKPAASPVAGEKEKLTVPVRTREGLVSKPAPRWWPERWTENEMDSKTYNSLSSVSGGLAPVVESIVTKQKGSFAPFGGNSLGLRLPPKPSNHVHQKALIDLIRKNPHLDLQIKKTPRGYEFGYFPPEMMHRLPQGA